MPTTFRDFVPEDLSGKKRKRVNNTDIYNTDFVSGTQNVNTAVSSSVREVGRTGPKRYKRHKKETLQPLQAALAKRGQDAFVLGQEIATKVVVRRASDGLIVFC